MYRFISKFFVPRSKPHLIRLTVILTLAVIIVSSINSAIVYRLFYPEIVPFLTLRYYAAMSVVVVTITVPFGLVLMAAGLRLQTLNHRFKTISRTDNLTGLPNRGSFLSRARTILDSDTYPGALLLVDADRFKTVNDTFGHQTGDAALKVIAWSLQRSIRQEDIVGRIGGEEFGVFLRNAEPPEAELIAERIRRDISNAAVPTDEVALEIRISVSVGGVHIAEPSSFEACFKKADASLYEAKEAGRNRVVFSQAGDFAAA